MVKEPGEKFLGDSPEEQIPKEGEPRTKAESERLLSEERRGYIKTHGEMFERYFVEYFGQKEDDAATENAAFEILSHGALRDRYSGSGEVFKLCKSLKPQILRKLVLDACASMKKATFEEDAKRLTQTDALSDEDLRETEDLLIARDHFEASWQLSNKLAHDELDGDDELRGALAKAKTAIKSGDEHLLKRPDITSVASRILDPLREMAKEPLDHEDYWWFFKAREQDEEYEKASSSGPEFAKFLGLPPDIFEKLAEGKNKKTKKEK